MDALRTQLIRILDWEEAHVGFDKAVAGIPANQRTVLPVGFEHSAWDLVEHLRIAQADILDFCLNAVYSHDLAWPRDYWPKAAPKNDAAWSASIEGFKRDREAMKKLARDTEDLTVAVPTGKPKQT